MWHRIDYESWVKHHSSMVIPLFPKPPFPQQLISSAIGDKIEYLVRDVLTISFPALCFLFGDTFTAVQLEEAWLKMPLVKPCKPSRGTNAGNQRKGRKKRG